MSYYEDEIYHSAYSDGYLDGYYAGMELYHADDEMTEEEKARRKRRRRNIALGVTGAAVGAGVATGGYAIGRALRKRGRLTGPTLKRVKVNPYTDVEEPIGWDFKRNKPKYASDHLKEQSYKTYETLKKHWEYNHDTKKWRLRPIYED